MCFGGGREGAEVDAAKNGPDTVKVEPRGDELLHALCQRPRV